MQRLGRYLHEIDSPFPPFRFHASLGAVGGGAVFSLRNCANYFRRRAARLPDEEIEMAPMWLDGTLVFFTVVTQYEAPTLDKQCEAGDAS